MTYLNSTISIISNHFFRFLDDIEPAEAKWYSILPPILALGLALITKEVLSSLMAGIVLGSLIYVIVMKLNFMKVFELPFIILADNIGGGSYIILFVMMLGALVYVIRAAGGTAAYGRWALKAIKSKRGAKLSTMLLSFLLFIDDYFSCITSGTVMKPVTDMNRVSREKLAYIVDGLGVSMCVLVPISSWAAVIISTIEDSGSKNGLTQLIKTIPFNLYGILTIIMELFICISGLDYGPMATAEEKAGRRDPLINLNEERKEEGETEENKEIYVKVSKHGRVFDLLIPILLLIVLVFLFMISQGGGFEGNGKHIEEIFGDADASLSLSVASGICLVVCLFMYLPRKLLTFTEFVEGIRDGMKMMVPTVMILCLAWGIGSVAKDYLKTGEWIGQVLRDAKFPNQLLPFIVFLFAAILSFSIGSAWGTFGILIPIVNGICETNCPELCTICIASVLSGSIFGDHCSPISDTTVISSTAAQCNLIDHVRTQLPYAITVAFCCAMGFLFGGLSNGKLYVALPVGLGCEIILLTIIFILHKYGLLQKIKCCTSKPLIKQNSAIESELEKIDVAVSIDHVIPVDKKSEIELNQVDEIHKLNV